MENSTKLLQSAFASCTPPLTAKQIEARVLFFVIFLISRLCECFRAWLLAVCVLVKVSQGSQNLGGLAVCAATVHCVTSLCQLLQHQRQAGLSCLTACPGASPKTRWRNLSLVSIVLVSNTDKKYVVVLGGFRTWPKLWKHRWPKYLQLLANGILKTVLHHADCPSTHLGASPLLCVREDFGSKWK